MDYRNIIIFITIAIIVIVFVYTNFIFPREAGKEDDQEKNEK